jgi:hypothetical protein
MSGGARPGSGPKPSTGRFTTRAELCAWVWRQYLNGPANVVQIAGQCHVGESVVRRIITNREGHPG